MKRARFPHSLALIFAMIVVAQVLTYLIPAGEYDHARKKAPLREGERGLELPAAHALLLPEDRQILLPEGERILLPTARPIHLDDGTVLPPAAPREVALPDGGTARFAPTAVHRTATGDRIHLPPEGAVILPAGTPTPDGHRVLTGGTIRLPEGSFRLVPGRRIEEGTFHLLPPEDAPTLPWYAFLTKIPKGLEAGAEIIFFVFIVGGVIAVVRATGAIDAMIATAIRRLGHNRALLVTGMMTLFAVGSSTIGMAEEYMPFIPILVAMAIALGLDAIVALGIVYIGAGVGYGCAALNPFTVAIAKDIAGTGIEQGFWLRWGLLLLMLAIGVHHVLRYSRRIAADHGRSLVADVDYSEGYDMPEDTAMTPRRAAVLAAFAGGITLFIVGVETWDWYLTELAAVFLGLALFAAAIAGLTPNAVASSFCTGAAELTTTALLIGFARTIEVVFTDAAVIHTIVHGISETLNGLDSPALAANGMLLVQSVCNFLIPSGSGQAYVTMPIMAPVAELTEVGSETAVLAYQFGDGFTNMIAPTNALLMGMLALGRVPYQRWLRFILPLMVKVYLVAFVVLAIAGSANYGSPS